MNRKEAEAKQQFMRDFELLEENKEKLNLQIDRLVSQMAAKDVQNQKEVEALSQISEGSSNN